MSAYNWTIEWARVARVRTLAKLEIGSTNAEAKSLFSDLGHRSLVIADHQTSGRGRGDHDWRDGAGHALLSSWVFESERAPQPITSALIGLALFESVKKTWPRLRWALKAPNDLHVTDESGKTAKKLAGLLIELVSQSPKTAVIVGLGMNVNGAPQGTRPYEATSLASELSAKGLGLTESEWNSFLTTWIRECETALKNGLESKLTAGAREGLLKALSRHPEYENLDSVGEDGSLQFKNGRKISWTEL